MIEKEIKDFAEYLKEEIPLTKVEVYDSKTDEGFKGFTDSHQNYGFIVVKSTFDGDLKQYELSPVFEEYGFGTYRVNTSCYLLLDMDKKDYNPTDVMYAVSSKLIMYNAADIIYKGIGTDKDAIFKKISGSGWTDCKNYPLCFEFDFSIIKNLKNNICLK